MGGSGLQCGLWWVAAWHVLVGACDGGGGRWCGVCCDTTQTLDEPPAERMVRIHAFRSAYVRSLYRGGAARARSGNLLLCPYALKIPDSRAAMSSRTAVCRRSWRTPMTQRCAASTPDAAVPSAVPARKLCPLARRAACAPCRTHVGGSRGHQPPRRRCHRRSFSRRSLVVPRVRSPRLYSRI